MMRTHRCEVTMACIQGAISDGGAGYSLTKTGVGTLILFAANTYSGGTFMSAGTLM